MTSGYQIVVCGGLVPDPLQTLEPVSTPNGPALKNEMMLPVALDPWAGHALYEAAHLAKQIPGSKVWLVSLGAKPKLQQLMMSVAQKAAFEFVPVEGNAGGFMSAYDCAAALTAAIKGIAGLDMTRLLLFGGWESASRGAGSTLQLIGESLGIMDQFMGVDEIKPQADGSFTVLERVEGARHQESLCQGAPAVLGWATGSLPEPMNNPQIGMMNMRSIMPALQRAPKANVALDGIEYTSVELPKQQRDTRIVKDLSVDQIAQEIVDWIKQ